MSIGLLGGTFDPIHHGHLRGALEVMQGLGLEEIRFIPLRQPPHRETPVVSVEQRLAMLRLAIQGQPGFRIEERELHREGPSYTFDTLSSLRAELGEMPLVLLVGADAFAGLPTWHRWRELIGLAHFVVMRRPGAGDRLEGETAKLLGTRVTDHPVVLGNSSAGHLYYQSITQLDISATAIRAMLARGESPRFLMPPKVWDHIRENGLYGV